MSSEPLVTVVVPAFERPRYLEVALASALAQTFQRFILVVADDGGPTDLSPIVLQFGDPRIVHVRNTRNLGMAANAWTQLRAARTRYVATLHDDDAWEPQFLDVAVEPLERDPSLAASFTDHWLMDETGTIDEARTIQNTHRFGRAGLARGMVRDLAKLVAIENGVPSAMASVFRRDAVDWDDFPVEVGTFYDFWLTYLAARAGRPFHFDPRRLTRYRVHRGSETASWREPGGAIRARRQLRFVLERLLDEPFFEQVRPALLKRYLRAASAVAVDFMRTGKFDEARSVAVRTAQIAPGAAAAAVLALSQIPSPIAQLLARIVHALGSR